MSDAVEGTFGGPGWLKPSGETERKTPEREWKRTKGVDRTEMRKEEKRLRCASLIGSAWSTERKYMKRYKGTFDVFFGMEHRLRKEEVEEQFKERGQGRREVCSGHR